VNRCISVAGGTCYIRGLCTSVHGLGCQVHHRRVKERPLLLEYAGNKSGLYERIKTGRKLPKVIIAPRPGSRLDCPHLDSHDWRRKSFFWGCLVFPIRTFFTVRRAAHLSPSKFLFHKKPNIQVYLDRLSSSKLLFSRRIYSQAKRGEADRTSRHSRLITTLRAILNLRNRERMRGMTGSVRIPSQTDYSK
jgi:hypothetical protein